VVASRYKNDLSLVARWPSNNRSGTWRSSARDAPGVSRALNRLGKRVRVLRLARRLTQERAAEIAKLDEKHWQDIEGSRTNPTVATLVGIARALKVSLSGLFEDTDDARVSTGPSAGGAGRAAAGASRRGSSSASSSASRRRDA
jgi:transcriptional regulator with XRE-family HTH domain